MEVGGCVLYLVAPDVRALKDAHGALWDGALLLERLYLAAKGASQRGEEYSAMGACPLLLATGRILAARATCHAPRNHPKWTNMGRANGWLVVATCPSVCLSVCLSTS